MKKQNAPAAAQDDRLSLVLQNGADLQRRRLYLCGLVDEMTAYRFIVGLQTMDEEEGVITVVLNTAGGVCEDGFAIYDTIKFARNEVIVIGFGQVASMGSIIMQAGDRRLLSAECDFMIHDMAYTGGNDGMSLQEVNRLNHQLQRMQRRGNRILVEASRQPEEQIVKWCEKETTFSAAQAVRAGFADLVLHRKQKKARKVRK